MGLTSLWRKGTQSQTSSANTPTAAPFAAFGSFQKSPRTESQPSAAIAQVQQNRRNALGESYSTIRLRLQRKSQTDSRSIFRTSTWLSGRTVLALFGVGL